MRQSYTTHTGTTYGAGGKGRRARSLRQTALCKNEPKSINQSINQSIGCHGTQGVCACAPENHAARSSRYAVSRSLSRSLRHWSMASRRSTTPASCLGIGDNGNAAAIGLFSDTCIKKRVCFWWARNNLTLHRDRMREVELCIWKKTRERSCKKKKNLGSLFIIDHGALHNVTKAELIDTVILPAHRVKKDEDDRNCPN
jgi:hypothetical protein